MDLVGQNVRAGAIDAVHARVVLVADPAEDMQLRTLSDLIQALDVAAFPGNHVVPARVDHGRPFAVLVSVIGSEADAGHLVLVERLDADTSDDPLEFDSVQLFHKRFSLFKGFRDPGRAVRVPMQRNMLSGKQQALRAPGGPNKYESYRF